MIITLGCHFMASSRVHKTWTPTIFIRVYGQSICFMDMLGSYTVRGVGIYNGSTIYRKAK